MRVEEDTRAKLLGGWHLVGWRIEYSDGRAPTFPYGEDVTGLLMYTDDGFMSACIAKENRPGLGGASTRSVPGAEKENAFDGYFQYAGRYEVSGEHVLHRVTHSLNPDFPGTTQKRRIDLDRGELVLSAEETLPDGLTRRHILRWRRS